MAELTLFGVTIPTPAPYDDKDPTKQIENLCYVLLQVFQIVQDAGFKFGDIEANTAIVQAVKDLQYNDQIIDFGVFRVALIGKYQET